MTVPSLPNVIARDHAHPERQMVWPVADRHVQAADLADMQLIARGRHDRLGRMIAKDGERRDGCEVLVNRLDETIILGAGAIYLFGDTFRVEARTIENAPLVGHVAIGVRAKRHFIDHEDDPALAGQVPGTEAEGEAGQYREVITIDWALADEEIEGEFVPVYEMIDGTIIDQLPPPALSGLLQTIGIYDFDANGHYIVDGCEVTAVGNQAGAWVFSIGAGTANIRGYKRVRETAFRYAQVEEADLEDVVAEVHPFTGPTGGQTTVQVTRAPIASLTSAIVVKRITETRVRGPVPGTADALTHSSVVAIEEVKQGATVFAVNTYELVGGEISWSPSGAEPSGSSTYEVTYLYQDAVTPDAVTATSVTVSGGVIGTQITLRYQSKLPRIDLICLEMAGTVRYIKGTSARRGALAPQTPTSLLKLAEVHNDWLGLPRVVNNGTRNFTYDQMRRLFGRLIDVLDQFDRQSAQHSILEATPVSKKGIFTDNFVDDFFRDQGEPQTAATNQGVLQLAIDNVMMQLVQGGTHTLAYDERIVVSQLQRTSSMKINPYDNFVAMPAGLKLEPAADFWTEQATVWASPVTREFTAAPDQPPGQTVINEVTELRRDTATFLRQIEVTARVEGFGVGEALKSLVFDGVDLTPTDPILANANGEIAVTFTIPANTPAGRRAVRVTGEADSFAQAIFVGEGVIDVATMRRVTLVSRAAPVPIINNITNITQEITNIEITQITQQLITNVTTGGGGGSGGGGGQPDIETPISRIVDVGGVDPLAQTFMVPTHAMVVGLNFWFTDIGDRTKGVRVQLAEVQNGYPTNIVAAETFINMQTVAVGEKVEARFELPVYCAPEREYCFVILTADDTHAVAISRLGDIDPATQRRVASQPYTIGVLFSSANRLTWTAHQDADLAMEIVTAAFTETSRTVTLWAGELDAISDLMVRCAVDLPTEDAGFRLELVRANGEVTRFAIGQTLSFNEFVSEEVTIRAVLSGTPWIAPVIFPASLIAGGRIRTSGTYVSRLFPFGSAVQAAALFAARLPAGSNVTVDVRGEGGAWQSMTLGETGVLGAGWTEPKYSRPSITAAQGQIRLTLTGNPAARPSLGRARAYTL